ncbi:MAG: homocysteine S-methyltransferase family protein [Thermoanaerobaculales bacterium]|nr:homocysteine S-methyltransferase family protein [Thermoanaerobaculales bacterium]
MLKRLMSGDRLVGDGAWGSLLMARGLPPGACPDAMNLQRPEVLEEIAAEYLEAGADLLTTNTFGGSPLALERYGLESRVEEINRRGAEIIAGVTGGRALVSASVGPSGRILKPYGDTDPGVVGDGFRRQVAALAEGGADVICIETMTDLEEACLAVDAARLEAPGLPVMASMTFEAIPRGFFTVMGVSVEAAVVGLCDRGADIIGTNCGNGIDLMVSIAEELARHSSVPVLVQSNAGLPVADADGVVYPEGPEFFSDRITALLQLGVAVIGGCCGTTFDHVRVIRRQVDRWIDERPTV